MPEPKSGDHAHADDKESLPVAEPTSSPWFAGRECTVLLFRVNRRPFPQPTFFSQQPEDVLEHLVQVLPFGEGCITKGRRGRQRRWVLGNQETDEHNRTLTGRIGWESQGRVTKPDFDDDLDAWTDVVTDDDTSRYAPFVFDAKSRVLAVLRHSSFAEHTVASVFEKLLRRGESERQEQSTEWSVESLLDKQSFLEWLASADAVLSVTLVTKLPNPSASPEFTPVWGKMAERKARVYRQMYEAADEARGLIGLTNDREVAASIAMSEKGFGYVSSTITRDGRKQKWDGRVHTKQVQTAELPPDWPQVYQLLLKIAQSQP